MDWLGWIHVLDCLPWASGWQMVFGDRTHGLSCKSERYRLWSDGERIELTGDQGKEFRANGELWFMNNRDLVRAATRTAHRPAKL